MRELTTTLLDGVGLLLVAAGTVGGTWPFAGAWALCVGGVVVLAGSWLASWSAGRETP